MDNRKYKYVIPIIFISIFFVLIILPVFVSAEEHYQIWDKSSKVFNII